MRSKKEIQLLEALEEAALSRGFDLVDIELTGSGRNSLLRIYIDKPGGLSLDDVASANTWIASTVEALDPYKGSYTLEVSSPGIDRPLRTIQHFEQAIGQEVVITLDNALTSGGVSSEKSKPRQKYTGNIVAVDPQKQLISLEADKEIYELEFLHIKKARVKGRLDFETRKDS